MNDIKTLRQAVVALPFSKQLYATLLATPIVFAQPTLTQQQSFECVIDPAKLIDIASPVRGIVQKVTVRRGEKVKKGQVIAKLESSVETTTVDLLRIQAEGTALIDIEKEQLAMSKKFYERAESLKQNSAISDQELDELRADFNIQERELAKALMDHKVAKMELKRAQAILEQRTIRSPEDGVITEKVLSSGEFIDENTHIATMAKLDPLHVETFVPTELFKRIKEGLIGIVKPEAPYDTELKAEVIIVDPVLDAASGTFGVRLKLPNKNNALPGGIRCWVTFPDINNSGDSLDKTNQQKNK